MTRLREAISLVNKVSRLIVFSAALISAGASFAFSQAEAPVSAGKTPSRIVSLAPSNTEILFALGLGDRVIGVDTYSNYPAETQQIQKIGGFSEPNIEVITALQPDLVVATGMHAKFLPQFDTLEIPVLVLDASTVEEVLGDIRRVGQITGTADRAESLIAEITAEIDGIQERASSLEKVRVYYEVFSDPLITIGPNTLITQLIAIAGGQIITPDAPTDYPRISSESVIAANPEVIIYPEFHGTGAMTAEMFETRVGWNHIRAVDEGRIYPINADIISRTGPRIGEAAKLLFDLLHAE